MKTRLISLILIFTFILASCSAVPKAVAVQPVSGLPKGTDGYAWWNDTTFYEIFVRSFSDSNGDGIGDFNGITSKLDYLKDLGITGIWLMPINPSPSYHGYDITDYESVNPDYGTMDDFKNLLSEAHKRGIRVIIDLVLNHTSDQDPWFIAAQEPNSPYRNYYIWSDTDPGYKGPWGEQVWYKTSTGYYYAIFAQNMPDLNFRNPDVTTQMENIAKFWLQDVGIDGFRLDAARHLIEEGNIQVNTNSTHSWLQQFFAFYKNINPNAFTVGELNGESPDIMSTYVAKNQLDTAFDFTLATSFIFSANTGLAKNATSQLRVSYKLLPKLQDAIFLTNHDQDRLMTDLGNNPDKVKVAASLLLTSPGVPFLYYGEEVGLEGSGEDPDKRRPMQWCSDQYACFSTVTPWESVGPAYQDFNVETEMKDPQSILSQYRTLINLRNQHAALRVGDSFLPNTNAAGLFADLRQSKNEIILVLINVSKSPISDYDVDLSQSTLEPGDYRALALMGGGPFPDLDLGSDGKFQPYQPVVEIPPYSTIIIQLQRVNK
jgi:alpha-amylase